MREYPTCFPEDFRSRILPSNVEFLAREAHRVIWSGVICRDEFLGTYEKNPSQKPRKPKENSQNEFKKYSTSLWREYDRALNIIQLSTRQPPHPIIAIGYTVPCCGPSLVEEPIGHIHWFLFQNADPSKYFKEVETA